MRFYFFSRCIIHIPPKKSSIDSYSRTLPADDVAGFLQVALMWVIWVSGHGLFNPHEGPSGLWQKLTGQVQLQRPCLDLHAHTMGLKICHQAWECSSLVSRHFPKAAVIEAVLASFVLLYCDWFFICRCAPRQPLDNMIGTGAYARRWAFHYSTRMTLGTAISQSSTRDQTSIGMICLIR